MGSVDKAAIGWTIAIVLFGAGIAVVGSSLDQSDSKQDMAMMGSMNDDKMMMEDKKMTDMEKMMEDARESSSDKTSEKMMEEKMMKEEMMMEEKMMKEEMMMEETGPVTKYVSIPSGTSVPGCEETNECFIPADISINAGDTVSWTNDDTAVHTATGGGISTGNSGVFDSSLISNGASFDHTFDDAGTFDYFCVVHPWMSGSVSVN